eukprot:488864_1
MVSLMDAEYFNVGDHVEYNTDPDDDEEALHIHIGHIVEIQNKFNQISIKSKQNNQICTYFIDEIVITNKINDIHVFNRKRATNNMWKFSIDDNNIQNIKQTYHEQCPQIFTIYPNWWKDKDLMKLLIIGHTNNIPYLQFLIDMYARYC